MLSPCLCCKSPIKMHAPVVEFPQSKLLCRIRTADRSQQILQAIPLAQLTKNTQDLELRIAPSRGRRLVPQARRRHAANVILKADPRGSCNGPGILEKRAGENVQKAGRFQPANRINRSTTYSGTLVT